MADDVDLVRSRVDLVSLISERVTLKRSGQNWKGLCPFHDDRNPSFYVNPRTGTYRCWSCGEKGDVFTWVMKTQNVDFRDSLESLARLAGVDLKKRSPQDRSLRERRLATMQAALEFFQIELRRSKEAQAYLERRSLHQESIVKWEIGFAPHVGEALVAHLKRSGHSLAEASELFLVQGDEANGYSDRFVGRLMFPIRDTVGDLVAFGGRVLGDGVPKYINSGDTPVFSKRHVLYGMYQAKEAIRAARIAVLVEGYLDVIACHRAGVKTAVASLGTSLSEDHAKLLKRWCDSVTILYDSDTAGLSASDRATAILQSAGLGVTIASVPQGKDPDTLIREIGPEAVVSAAAHGMSPTEFRLAQIRARLQPSEQEFWNEVVHVLSQAPEHLEAVRHLEGLASEYPGLRDPAKVRDLLEKQVIGARRKRGRSGHGAPLASQAVVSMGDLNAYERHVLQGAMDAATVSLAWPALLESDLFPSAIGIHVAEVLIAACGEAAPDSPPSVWLHKLDDDGVVDILVHLAGQEWEAISPNSIHEAIAELRRQREARTVRSLTPAAAADEEALREVIIRLKALDG